MQELTFFCVARQFGFGESNVERDEQSATNIVIVVIRHSLALLSNARTWPGDFVFFDGDFTAVQMFDVESEAVQRVLQGKRQVRVEVVADPLEDRMHLGTYSANNRQFSQTYIMYICA